MIFRFIRMVPHLFCFCCFNPQLVLGIFLGVWHLTSPTSFWFRNWDLRSVPLKHHNGGAISQFHPVERMSTSHCCGMSFRIIPVFFTPWWFGTCRFFFFHTMGIRIFLSSDFSQGFSSFFSSMVSCSMVSCSPTRRASVWCRSSVKAVPVATPSVPASVWCWSAPYSARRTTGKSCATTDFLTFMGCVWNCTCQYNSILFFFK